MPKHLPTIQPGAVLSQVSTNYPKLYSHFKSLTQNYSAEIREANDVQSKLNETAARVEYESQPAHVAGRIVANIYDYLFPPKPNTAKKNLRGEVLSDRDLVLSIAGGSISTEQLQSIIDARRSNATGGVVDLRDLSGLRLQGETLTTPFDDDDDRVSNVDLDDIQIFSDLNVSHTNFPEVFSMNSSYFRGGDFSGLRFKSMESVFFEGCRLTSSDWSNTVQSNVYLAGLSSYFLVREIRSLDSDLHYYRDEMTEAEYEANLQKAQQLKKAYAQLHPTKVNKVNLDDTRFVSGVYDDWMTDYQDTSFRKVAFDFPRAELIGRNLNLSGASYKLEDGSYYEIKDAISAEEVERRSGPYMAAMLRNNIIQPRGEKKTVFAMSPTGLNSDVVNATNRCNDVFGSGPTYAPINMADMQKIISSFNETYGKEFNAEFVSDDGMTPYDYRITLCETWDAPRLGYQTPNTELVDQENYIEISRVLTNVGALSHEFFHILGGNHPFDAGVLPTKSSHFATVLSYSNAMDLMLPIANESSPLTLLNNRAYDSFTSQGMAVQDRDFLTIVLGANPNFQPQDVLTTVNSEMTRIIHGDEDYKNTAVIDTAWGGKYVVLDASQSIGTCFKFPCEQSDIATGIAGTLVVFYDDSGPAIKITGHVLLFGGKVNQVIADGKVIEPINPALVNGANVTAAEFQAEINQRKIRSGDGVIDLSDLQDVVIQAETIWLDSYNKIENVVEGLDVSGTNFAQVFNLDGKYFKDCSFAGVRFGNTTDTTFEGCDLTDADMSNTVQSGLALGADLATIQLLMDTDNAAYNQMMREFVEAVRPTKFINVNLQNAVVKDSGTPRRWVDNYLTDYDQTDFNGVEIRSNGVMSGRNLDLTGAILRTSYSEMERSEVAPITNPIPAEEVASSQGEYLEAMIRNNIINRISDKKTTIAIASALQASDREFFDKCQEIYSYADRSDFIPANITDLQKLADIYNSEYATRYNVEFVVDATNQPHDFRLNVCLNVAKGLGEAGTIGLLDPELYVGLGYDLERYGALHELGHILGANHPFESGVDPAKCSVWGSVMCYSRALDIMLPLGNEVIPARLSSPENPAPQDHKFTSFLFGENPAYQPQNYQANITAGQNRIIYGDVGYNNTASLDTSSLPEGVKWIVLDAAKSIGTCYSFPCRKEDLADGLSGNMLVLYKENILGRPEVLGSTLLFGGTANNFFVDGQEIDPVSPDFSLTPSPTSKPTTSPSLVLKAPTRSPTSKQTPEQTPEQTGGDQTSSKNQDNLVRNLVLGLGIPFVALAVGTVICCLKKSGRNRVAPDAIYADVDDIELAQLDVSHHASGAMPLSPPDSQESQSIFK